MAQPGSEQLVVRQHERFLCRMPTLVRVAEDAAEQVTLSRAIGDGTGAIDVFITDASRGGLGIESHVFMPRGCRLKIRVQTGIGGSVHDLTLRVQRVTMLDRKPTYYLGLSFVSKGPDNDLGVGVLLELARKATMITPPVPGGA